MSNRNKAKAAERELVDLVYGQGLFGDLEDFERPDFLFRREGLVVHGVEVTRFYLSESDARVREIPEYGLDLLNGGPYRHKDDPAVLPVQEVTYHAKGAGPGKRIKALCRDLPSEKECLDLLSTTIGEKNAKVAEYQNNAPSIDLVISDPATVFRVREFGRFLHSLGASQAFKALVSGGFREVFLVTRSGEKPVYIPLKSNLLAKEVFTGEQRFKAAVSQGLPHKSGVDCLRALLWRLSEVGMGAVSVKAEESSVAFRYGNHEFTYNPNGRNLSERTDSVADADGWRTVDSWVDGFDAEDRELAQAVLQASNEGWGYIPLLFDAGTRQLMRVEQQSADQGADS